MQKEKIGVDLDDTVLQFVDGLCRYTNRAFGATSVKEHHTQWELHKTWGVSKDEATRWVRAFVESREHHEIDAVDGAKEALAHFAQHAEVVGITGRDDTCHSRIWHLLDRHFPELFSHVHFVGVGKNKVDTCVQLGIRFMVEDAAHHAEYISEAGIRVYLMDRPWNRMLQARRNIIRVFSWADVLAHEDIA